MTNHEDQHHLDEERRAFASVVVGLTDCLFLSCLQGIDLGVC